MRFCQNLKQLSVYSTISESWWSQPQAFSKLSSTKMREPTFRCSSTYILRIHTMQRLTQSQSSNSSLNSRQVFKSTKHSRLEHRFLSKDRDNRLCSIFRHFCDTLNNFAKERRNLRPYWATHQDFDKLIVGAANTRMDQKDAKKAKTQKLRGIRFNR